MSTGYFDRKQQPITKARWEELQRDEGYSILKRFRDDRVHIEARWVGKLANPQNYFPYLRPVFAVLIFNRDSAGNWQQDPRHGTTYHDERKLLAAYNDFVLEWTQSTLNEEGELEEIGNELKAIPESEFMAAGPKTTLAKNLVGVSAEVAAVGVW